MIGVELKSRSQQPGVLASPTRQIVEDVTQLSEMLRWWTYRRRASASDLTGSLTRQQAKVSDHRVIRECPSACSGDELLAGHVEKLTRLFVEETKHIVTAHDVVGLVRDG